MKSRRSPILSINILATSALVLLMSQASQASGPGTWGSDPGPQELGIGDEAWLPFALAPTGQYGASLNGEYDWREINGDKITVRRMLFRLGGTPTPYSTFWVEGGLASLELETGSRTMEGDYGTAAGAGITLSIPNGFYQGLTPFGSGRITYFNSCLSDDWDVTRLVRQARRSRYEWLEGFGVFGLTYPVRKGMILGGMVLRALSQDESRTTRTNNNDPYKQEYSYDSGLKGGAMAAVGLRFKHRFSAWVSAEYFIQSDARVTVAIGQWGRP